MTLRDAGAATAPTKAPAARRRVYQLPPCPACGGRQFRFRVIKKGRRVWRCVECGVELQHPLPTQEELREYYDESYREGLYRAFADAAEMKRLTAVRRYREIAPSCPVGKWLDVGCANGAFVGFIRQFRGRPRGS